MWWYRHIDGMGDVELLFYDPTISNEYRLAMHPDELDAWLHVPELGNTVAEEMGLADRRDRSIFNPSAWYNPENMQNPGSRIRDAPFTMMERFFNVQRAPRIRFEDLKSVVTTHVTYNALPFDVRTDYLWLSENSVLVPITVEISNSELEFRKERDFNRAKIHVYGIVTGLTNRIHAEWEDEIAREFIDLFFDHGKGRRSTYQKIVMLPPGQRYKLDLVLSDVNSKKVGFITMPLIVPRFDDPGLRSSTIILANNIAPAPINATSLEQYVIGDLRIVPNVRAEIVPGQNLAPYMQIYGMEVDQTTQSPSLDVEFAITRDGKVLEVVQASEKNSELLYYGQRVVLIGLIPTVNMTPGKYQLEIRVLDRISNNRLITTTEFTVIEPAPFYAFDDEER
jgi:hypothetical protein